MNVGAAVAAAGFFADFAVGGGLVGLAFFGLFKVNISVKVSWRTLPASVHNGYIFTRTMLLPIYPYRYRGMAPDFYDSLLYAALYQAMKGI